MSHSLRYSLFAVFTVLLSVMAGAVALAQEEPDPIPDEHIFDIEFPVDGPNQYTDTWGAARSGSRTHEGTDIMADKMTPVLAAADGVVGWVGTECCYFELEHDGFETWYIHLNNDTPGTDDGAGWGIAEGIERGATVTRGQVIGWVGDSGNAEESGSHLHFEIRIGGVAINSYPSLVAAEANVDHGLFLDDDGSVHESDIDTLAGAGITKGCNPPENTLFCPDRLITRAEIAAFIRRTLQLPDAGADFFADDDDSVFNGDINALMAAGIGFGCTDTEFCPNEPLLRDEMAQMIVNGFAEADPERYADDPGANFFVDDDENPYEDAIDMLMGAGVTKGCNPPDNDQFCPDRPLIRAELASFFVRALPPIDD